jgi:hypothetical protein
MAKRTKYWAAMTLLALAGMAWAQQAWVPLEQRLSAEQLREVDLTTTQLDLLNRYLREAEAKAPPITTARDGGADPTRFIGLVDAERIASKVKGSVSGWEPGTVFALENGQQWKVLKGSMKLRRPLQDPLIMLVPGLAGRWFLQVDEDMPKARVYRID